MSWLYDDDNLLPVLDAAVNVSVPETSPAADFELFHQPVTPVVDIPADIAPTLDQGIKDIRIRNLQWWTTEADLRNLLSDCGVIKSVEFDTAIKNGKSLGIATITFDSSDAALRGIDTVDSTSINGRMAQASLLVVEEANLRPNEAPTGYGSKRTAPSSLRRVSPSRIYKPAYGRPPRELDENRRRDIVLRKDPRDTTFQRSHNDHHDVSRGRSSVANHSKSKEVSENDRKSNAEGHGKEVPESKIFSEALPDLSSKSLEKTEVCEKAAEIENTDIRGPDDVPLRDQTQSNQSRVTDKDARPDGRSSEKLLKKSGDAETSRSYAVDQDRREVNGDRHHRHREEYLRRERSDNGDSDRRLKHDAPGNLRKDFAHTETGRSRNDSAPKRTIIREEDEREHYRSRVDRDVSERHRPSRDDEKRSGRLENDTSRRRSKILDYEHGVHSSGGLKEEVGTERSHRKESRDTSEREIRRSKRSRSEGNEVVDKTRKVARDDSSSLLDSSKGHVHRHHESTDKPKQESGFSGKKNDKPSHSIHPERRRAIDEAYETMRKDPLKQGSRVPSAVDDRRHGDDRKRVEIHRDDKRQAESRSRAATSEGLERRDNVKPAPSNDMDRRNVQGSSSSKKDSATRNENHSDDKEVGRGGFDGRDNRPRSSRDLESSDGRGRSDKGSHRVAESHTRDRERRRIDERYDESRSDHRNSHKHRDRSPARTSRIDVRESYHSEGKSRKRRKETPPKSPEKPRRDRRH
uniref:RRM domain-containing protein n=1 Tax=Spongospora subterranea TaxID=70186 RepID=A0A0H5R8C2_9EUKA|eukprot:CRZ10383.1 hypothetical protein [Spongospora subterranea]